MIPSSSNPLEIHPIIIPIWIRTFASILFTSSSYYYVYRDIPHTHPLFNPAPFSSKKAPDFHTQATPAPTPRHLLQRPQHSIEGIQRRQNQ
jgi:hypothetical protein